MLSAALWIEFIIYFWVLSPLFGYHINQMKIICRCSNKSSPLILQMESSAQHDRYRCSQEVGIKIFICIRINWGEWLAGVKNKTSSHYHCCWWPPASVQKLKYFQSSSPGSEYWSKLQVTSMKRFQWIILNLWVINYPQ